MNHHQILTNLQNLFKTQKLAVIASDKQGHPYTNLVAFHATDDCQTLLFATNKNTTKYHNIKQNNQIAMLIDNRQNTEQDFHNTITITALGTAHETPNQHQFKEKFVHKHPTLTPFINDPQTVLFQLKVNQYYIVDQFQHVIKIHANELLKK